MLRREVLAGLLGLAASPALGAETRALPEPNPLRLGAGRPFSAGDVVQRAEALSRKAYAPPPRIDPAWTDLTYDEYRALRFELQNALWADQPDHPLELDVFPPGLYFPSPVEISVIEGGIARPLAFDLGVFNPPEDFPDLPIDDRLGYSGLRLRAELRRARHYEEFAVFQGASYFRAIGTGNAYGLSARGLAIDTGEAGGEEFPDFRAFWLEAPVDGDETYIVHALLDSPTTTGAYRFKITPGAPLVMDVEATLFPRRDCETAGIAPLTSMFWFDETNRHRFDDFRPQVHDSDGLLIVNGAGETLWRPLANPKTLQVSHFIDDSPRGFGLMQRARRYDDFADLEAFYHRRPSVWIEPGEDWGPGAVMLYEIPTDLEIYDNIVSFWRPAAGLKAGRPHRMSYRLTWGEDSFYGRGLAVLNTRMGAGFKGDGLIGAIDFAPSADVPEDLDRVEKVIHAYAADGAEIELSKGNLQRNPETGGPRLAFKFDPGTAQSIEFRIELRLEGKPLSEVWLYRWTA